MTIEFEEIVDRKVPGTQVETDWQGGVTTLPSTTKRTLHVGCKIAAGSATLHQIYTVASLATSIELFGEGSHLACMAERHFQVAPLAPLYQVCCTEGTGSCTQTLVVGSGPATAAGYIDFTIGGKTMQVSISVGDTADEVGEAIEAEVNKLFNAPFTASNSSGTVTITGRNLGEETETVRLRGKMYNGTGLTFTVTGATLTGTTTVMAPTTALANSEAEHYHVIGVNANASTNAGLLKTHVNQQSAPDVAKFCRGIVASVDTQSNAQTLAAAIDAYRMELVHMEECESPIWEMVAVYAALRAKTPGNQSLDGVLVPRIAPTNDESKWYITSEEESALGNGVSPLRIKRNGDVEIVRSIHTRVTTPSFIDAQIVDISDYVDEYIIGQFRAKYKGKRYKTLSPPGTTSTVTNDKGAKLLHQCLKTLDKEDWVQGADDDYDNGLIVAEQNATNLSRMDLAYPFRPIYFAHNICIRKQYTTPEL